ncbi:MULTISPECIES: SEL1-like repeat protein [unclassified Marinobacter]|uniref:SEL1-like repeat protein n=1 Tax=unclassified Marinobacter TaxID=83889 RepID=UPI001113CC5B|nr:MULTISPECIES: SEL1-like repeat protein [unclassified Marinobacter]MBQ0832799.1 SEL1-like repeat protein [Marinobacter sp.]
MHRLLVIMMSAVLIAGCGNLKTSDFLSRTGDALSKIGQKAPAAGPDQEIKPLFDQPYIDPLTEYLQRYARDPARTTQLEQVSQERERRCGAVARRYNTDEITAAGLASYRRGYSFSCAQDVAAYEARLEAMPPAPKPSQQPFNALLSDNTEVRDGEAKKAAVSRQLNDCYLLTRIRNFSDALIACRGPAEDGAAGAQANMAQIQYALGNHESAYRWAQMAVPESGQAAYLLGEIYAQGLGVAQDKNAAAKWFRTAAGLGHAGAENALNNLVSSPEGASAN